MGVLGVQAEIQASSFGFMTPTNENEGAMLNIRGFCDPAVKSNNGSFSLPPNKGKHMGVQDI